ncbi:PDDEXK nuclease domain-containing protein [Desulfoplanes sp.]
MTVPTNITQKNLWHPEFYKEVGDQDFSLGLLFYHLTVRGYVVVELKAVPCGPGFVGKLNLYLSAVDDLLCHPDDNPAIALLLCKSKNGRIVEYAWDGLRNPWALRIGKQNLQIPCPES